VHRVQKPDASVVSKKRLRHRMREDIARLLSVGLTEFSLNADAAEHAGLRRTQSFYLEHVGTAQNFVGFRT